MTKNIHIRSIRSMMALAGMFLLSGCIDHSYDLDKINQDSILQLGSIGAPIKKQDVLHISDIIDIDGNSYIVVAQNGDYSIHVSGQECGASYEIENFNVTPHMNHTVISEIPAKAFDGQVEMVHGFTTECFDIPSEITALKKVDVEGYITPRFSFTDTPSVSKIIMKAGSTLTFPEWIIVKDYDHSMLSLSGNVFTIVKDFEVTSDGLSSEISISGIDFTKANNGNLLKTNGSIRLEDAFTTMGHLVLNEKDIRGSINEDHYDITFYCELSNLKVLGAEAVVNPHLNIDFNPVRTSDMTSMFKEDDIFHIYDLALNLNLNNNTPLSAKISADIAALRSQTVKASAHINQIEVGADRSENLLISQREGIKVDNFTDLITPRPEMIEIRNFNISTSDSPASFQTGRRYDFTAGYSIDAPLAFCKDINISTDYILNLNLNAEDIDIENLIVSFSAVNTIPVGLSISGVVLDEKGAEVKGTNVSASKDIVPGTLSSPSTTPMTISIVPGQDLRYLKTLKLTLTAFSDEQHEGISLNKNQTLTLNNIGVKVNGVNYSL